jgi:hypothetical protein
MFFMAGNGGDRFTFAKRPDDSWQRVGSTNLPANRPPVTSFAVANPSTADCILAPLPPLALDKSKFEIVIAKFREDVAWADCYHDNVTIYSKDLFDAGRYPILPNLGRDAGTLLHHIVERYDSLAERTLFLQGNPFDHPLLSIPDFATDPGPFTSGPTNENRMGWSPHWTKPDQRIDAPVMQEFLRLAECDPNIVIFRWTSGMQFAVSREQIRRRPLDYYRRLFELTQLESLELAGRRFNNHHIIFIIELFWRSIFLVQNSGQSAAPLSKVS